MSYFWVSQSAYYCIYIPFPSPSVVVYYHHWCKPEWAPPWAVHPLRCHATCTCTCMCMYMYIILYMHWNFQMKVHGPSCTIRLLSVMSQRALFLILNKQQDQNICGDSSETPPLQRLSAFLCRLFFAMQKNARWWLRLFTTTCGEQTQPFSPRCWKDGCTVSFEYM